MSDQSQSPQNEFTIALNTFHFGGSPGSLFQNLEQQGFKVLLSSTSDNVDKGRLLVRHAAAYVVVVGFEHGPIPIPTHNNPEDRFLAEIQLDEAMQRGVPILLLFEAEDPRTRFGTPRIEAFRNRLIGLGKEFKSALGRFFVPFSNLVDFQQKAQVEVARLHDYLVSQANSASQLKEPESTPARPKRAPNFSMAAQQVLQRAGELASENNRVGLISSFILFALSDLASEQKTTERFVRDVLKRTDSYDEAFEKSLASTSSPEWESATVLSESGNISTNVVVLLANASDIAVRVSRGTDDLIFPRHIFAALLTAPEGESEPFAMRRLRDLGIKIDDLCFEFLEFTRKRKGLSEDPAEWAAILTPLSKWSSGIQLRILWPWWLRRH